MQTKNITLANGTYETVIGSTGKRAKFTPVPVSIDLAKLPVEAIEFALHYGLKQYIADGAAGSEDQAGFAKGIQQRLDNLASGTFKRAKGEASDKPDSVDARAKKLATQAIRAALKAKGAKADAKAIAEAAAKQVEAFPKWRTQAEAELAREAEERQALMESGDLDDILGDMLGIGQDGEAQGEEGDDETTEEA